MANLTDDVHSLARLQKQYARFLDGFANPVGPEDDLTEAQLKYVEGLRNAHIGILGITLRKLWQADSFREKGFRLLQLRAEILNSLWDVDRQSLLRKKYGVTLGEALERNVVLIDSSVDEKLPPPHPLEEVMQYLEKWLMRTHYCANPDCREPYFIATRQNQKFCSTNCSKPAQQEFKRRWWKKHGSQWRREQQSKGCRRKG